MNDLIAADQESANDVADNMTQNGTSPVSNFLSETLSAMLGTVTDFRDCR